MNVFIGLYIFSLVLIFAMFGLSKPPKCDDGYAQVFNCSGL